MCFAVDHVQDQPVRPDDERGALDRSHEREKAWGDIDQMISKDGAAIPLTIQKFTFVNGSGVKGAQVNDQYGGYLDLATISVK